MTQNVDISIEAGVFERLQRHSIPLTDTVSSVIARLIDSYERHSPKETSAPSLRSNHSDETIECDPAAPPNLTHTKPDMIKVNGQELPYSKLYWNVLMIEVIRAAASKVSTDELLKLVIVNHVEGERTDNNFEYVKEAGLSVQLQNTVAAWRAIYHIASKLNLSIEVEFHWDVKDKAEHPGRKGRLTL